MKTYYMVDSGSLDRGQHVSDEEVIVSYQNIELAEDHFNVKVASLSNRKFSYVYLLKYEDEKCVGILKSHYIN
jgi:hypothetical protein